MYIKFASNDKILLNYAVELLINSLDHLSVIATIFAFPIKIKKYTVLRSPHVDKKSRDQWERRTYSKLIKLTNLNSFTKLMILELVKKVPGGVSIAIIQQYKLNWII